MVRKQEFNEEELKNSKRIYKSATPKYTVDWWLKWVASIFILSALSMRGIDGFIFYDLILSIVGIGLWLIVSLSLIHIPSPRDLSTSRMPSSA